MTHTRRITKLPSAAVTYQEPPVDWLALILGFSTNPITQVLQIIFKGSSLFGP